MSNQSGWVVGGASSIGCRHIQENKPIEDNCYYQSWGNGWGIAVVSDGAGSRAKSAIGSRLVSHLYAPTFFKNNLKPFFNTSTQPSSAQWQKISRRAFYECAYLLNYYSTEHNDDINLYGCTVIVMVYTPSGTLCSHIGDGRACYRDKTGLWHAAMKPFNPNPENPNATVFITSPIWESVQTAEEHIGYRVIKDVTAFALLSDGVEDYCFTCKPRDPITGDDPNVPSQDFFEGIYHAFIGVKADKSKIEQKIADYLRNNPHLANEQDDKTLVFGYFPQES